MTMTLIETKTLGAAAASIEFTSIPQDGTDLVLLYSGRGVDTGSGRSDIRIQLNSSTTGYSGRVLRGYDSGTVNSATSSTSQIDTDRIPNEGATANTFGNTSIYFPNYTGSTNKSMSIDSVAENNSSSAYYMSITAGLWSNTAAITSIKIFSNVNIQAGSTISLYKVTSGTDGIVTTS